MSTVLERMIRRTRGPLSSLEPVVTPALAPAPPGGQGWAEPAGPPAHGGPGEQRSGMIADEAGPEEHLGRPSGTRRGRPRAAGGGRDAGARAAGGGRAAGQSDPGPEPVPHSHGRRSVSLGWPTAVGLPADADRREPGPVPPAMAADHADEAADDGARPAGPAAMAAGDSEALGGTAAGGAEPGPLPAGLRPGQPARPAESPSSWPSVPAPGAGQHERGAGALRGSGPDITISIGHIEVHSAPTAAEPRNRPRFRPQVSLADFLSQDRQP